MRTPLALFMLLAVLMPARGEVPAAPGSRGLIDSPFDHDGKPIVFEGEAIGEPMRRGQWAWVNVLDGYAAVGVFMTAETMKTISAYGSGKGKGDTIRVLGVFHRACPDHGGDLDIHAESVEIIERGEPTPHLVDPLVLVIIPISFAAAGLLFLFWRKRKAAVEARASRP